MTVEPRSSPVFVAGLFLVLLIPDGNRGTAFAQEAVRDTVAVENPKTLPDQRIACERSRSVSRTTTSPVSRCFPGGELLLTAFHQHQQEGGKVLEQPCSSAPGTAAGPGRNRGISTCSAANPI